MIKTFIKYREDIYSVIVLLGLISFMLSYALNSISVILLIVFFFLDSKENIINKLSYLRNNKVFLLYVLFFLTQIIGLLYSSNVSYGLKKITLLIPVLFVPGVIISETIQESKVYKILEVLKYTITCIFLYYIFFHFFIDERPLNNFVLYVINERLGVSQFYILFIVIVPLLYCLRLIELRISFLSNLFFVLFFIFCVFLLGNKTSLIFLFVIISTKGYNYLKNKSHTFKIFAIVASITSVMVVAYSMPGIRKKIDVLVQTTDFDLKTIITKNSVTYTKNTLEHRILINYISTKEFIKNFPIGVGTGDYQDVLNKNYDKINFKVAKKESLNNHNQYLSEFLKTGLLGGFCFLILMFLLLKSVSIKQNFCFYLVIFFAIGCLFESYLDRQHGVYIFAVLLPFFMRYEEQPK
ncbi:O-antigen ligase family protein [uncultured Aquimarina sp.]|uniref:O-antigen ligase family protein n=1 Tax=uncultured Aquimarina sp. TaxID=575652 RepID=UPI00260D3FF8|nr:O-antigen ligase family protein [uncultured Aquimarina sp.]